MKTAVSLTPFIMCIQNACALTVPTKALIEADWEKQEQISRNLIYDDPKALSAVLERGRLMISDMRAIGVDRPASGAEGILKQVEQELKNPPGSASQTRELYMKARWALRELAFSNPKIDFDEIVFVKRQWPRNNHQCSHRVGEAQIPGANLCLLKGLSPDGKVSNLLDEKYAKGGIGRFDLSYDAKRIVFPYAAPRPTPTPYGYVLRAELISYEIRKLTSSQFC